jgi:hypothetical protein
MRTGSQQARLHPVRHFDRRKQAAAHRLAQTPSRLVVVGKIITCVPARPPRIGGLSSPCEKFLATSFGRKTATSAHSSNHTQHNHPTPSFRNRPPTGAPASQGRVSARPERRRGVPLTGRLKRRLPSRTQEKQVAEPRATTPFPPLTTPKIRELLHVQFPCTPSPKSVHPSHHPTHTRRGAL